MTVPTPATTPTAELTLRTTTSDLWRTAVAACLSDGWRFAALYAAGGGELPALRVVFCRDAQILVLACAARDRRVASISELIPGAGWDEREAHDLHGWSFAGLQPRRGLVDHGDPTAAWTAQLSGDGAYQVAVGPIHAGIIESGHFRFSVVGDRILQLDVRLFYKHRGLEAAAEGRSPEDALAYVQRACAADAVSNAVAYAQACESARGLWPSGDLRRARTLLLELERLYNHLNDIAAICAGVGFAPGNMIFAALKERAQRLNARITGHRFLFDAVAVGASGLRVDAEMARATRESLAELRADWCSAWRQLDFAASLQDRLDGVGAITAQDVERFCGVGPVARAAGVDRDARTTSPRLDYDDFGPAAPANATGDVSARMQLRGAEIETTFDVLERVLARPLGRAAATLRSPPSAIGASAVEGPRGRVVCAVELDGGLVARVHLRTASYANWPLLALAARDNLLPDFPLINKSFELCYACVDR